MPSDEKSTSQYWVSFFNDPHMCKDLNGYIGVTKNRHPILSSALEIEINALLKSSDRP